MSYKCLFLDANLKVSSEECTEASTPKPFCPRQFFHVFNDKLCLDALSDLCYALISVEGGFNLEESKTICGMSKKGEKLMKMLFLLEKRANSQELLANALKYQIQRSEQRNWYDYLLQKVIKSKKSIDNKFNHNK